MKNKFIFILTITILIISIAGNILVFSYARQMYDKYNGLRLDPLGERYAKDILIEHRKYKYVILGDSIAYHWQMKTQDVLNLGVPSQTTKQVRIRSQYLKDQIKVKGEKLILIVGGNDLKSLGTKLPEADKILSNAIQNIKEIIDDNLDNFDEIIVSTITPLFYLPLTYIPFYNSKISQYHQELNHQIRQLERQYKRVTILDAYQILIDQSKMENLTTDGMHLNEQAYDYLNQHLK